MSKDKELTVKPATAASLKGLMTQAGPAKYASDDALSTVTKVGDWLPYIALHGSNSKFVKTEQIGMGHFGVHPSSGSLIDLGKNFVGLFLAWRSKAMQYAPSVLSFYDHTTKEFKEVELKAKTVKQSQCGVGPEYLVWLPEQKIFATYFLGNATGRNESANINGPMKDGPFVCQQKSKLIDPPKSEFSWHGPETKKHDLEIVMPSEAALVEEVKKFNNPPAATQEAAEEKDKEKSRQ